MDLRFVSYDHFNHISVLFDSYFLRVNLTVPNVHYLLLNPKAMFTASNATILSFAIVCDPDNLAKEPFQLTVAVLDSNNAIHATVPLVIKLVPCDIGHTILNHKCVICEGFSFEQNPTNRTQCQKCPDNAQCVNGKQIKSLPGFWNLNENDTNVLICENSEACKSSGICQKGY